MSKPQTPDSGAINDNPLKSGAIAAPAQANIHSVFTGATDTNKQGLERSQ